MIDPLGSSMLAATSGLYAQGQRMRIIAQNLANSVSTGETPGAEPYARKTITFAEAIDRQSGVRQVQVSSIGTDPSPFRLEYRPGHKAADANGYVKLPNVNPIVEVTDMQESVRVYQANIEVIKQTRQMYSLLSDLLRR
jgi:flagellar basal-body rod protein FlgC